MLDLSQEAKEQLKNARLLYYDFFNGILVFETLEERAEILKSQIAILKNALLKEDLEENILELENELNTNGVKNLFEEYSRIFSLPFGGKQVGMHLSHFYENCVGGESLLKIREMVKKSDVRVDTKLFKETEEHIGFLFGFMRYLIQKGDEELAKEVFLFCKDAFLKFCEEIKDRKDAKFYLDVALLLESFMNFEVEFYA